MGRHVLLIAVILVADQAGLAGSFIEETEQGGHARVLALQVAGTSGTGRPLGASCSPPVTG